MPNAAALIDEGLWRRDREFRALPRLAQCTYLQLLSQKDLDCAGVLTLHVDILVQGCAELTSDALWQDFKTLETARFIFVDAETYELFVRSYLRRISARSPNAYKSALRSARMVNSPKIRVELAAELRRLGRKDAREVADEIDPSEPDPEPIGTPSESPPEGVSLSNPPVSVPVLVPVLSSQGGSVGEDPPSPFCDQHPNGTNDSCPACGVCRRAREHWDQQQQRAKRAAADSAAAQRRADAEAAAQAIRACTLCDPDGYRNGTVCSHDPAQAETNRSGMAAVRAALGKPHQLDDEDPT
ncbi:hypothetical protein AWC11_07210 [Mycobacterium interjectum]|nr:hypothetical protein AWC11_07210 [Mycobacterium interjectum]